MPGEPAFQPMILRRSRAEVSRCLRPTREAVLLGAALLAGCQSNPSKPGEASAHRGGGYFSIAGIALGGGANKVDLASGYTGQLSAEALALRERAKKFDRTVWQGLLLGSLAGAAVGVATGQEAEGIAGFTIVGAGVGAIAGAYLANKQKEFGRVEDQLDAMIADVQRSIQETRELIEAARLVIAEDRRNIARLEQQLAQGRATEVQLQQGRERLRANVNVVARTQAAAAEQYAVLNEARSQFEQANTATNTAALSTELGRFERNINTLDQIVQDIGRS